MNNHSSGEGGKKNKTTQNPGNVYRNICVGTDYSTEITHYSLSNLAGRWEFGSPERQKSWVSWWGLLTVRQATPRCGQAGGARRARAVTAAPGKGGREPGPGLAGLRGGTRQRDGLSAARASARSLVIQHPDFQTGGRGRSSSLAVPVPGLRESVRPTLHAAPEGAPTRAPGPVHGGGNPHRPTHGAARPTADGAAGDSG